MRVQSQDLSGSQLTQLVRRVVGRVMGTRVTEVPHERPAGVHVAVDTPRPAEDRVEMARVRGSELVTVDDLAHIARGGELVLRPGAVVTPLAEDAARERGIRLSVKVGAYGSVVIAVALGFYAYDLAFWQQALLVTLALIGVTVVASLRTVSGARE